MDLNWLAPMAAVFLIATIAIYWRIDKDWGG